MDRFWLIGVHTAPRKGRPHGYEKPPDRVDYSPNFLKVVRVREVPSSNLGTPTRHVSRLPTRGSLFFRPAFPIEGRCKSWHPASTGPQPEGVFSFVGPGHPLDESNLTRRNILYDQETMIEDL